MQAPPPNQTHAIPPWWVVAGVKPDGPETDYGHLARWGQRGKGEFIYGGNIPQFFRQFSGILMVGSSWGPYRTAGFSLEQQRQPLVSFRFFTGQVRVRVFKTGSFRAVSRRRGIEICWGRVSEWLWFWIIENESRGDLESRKSQGLLSFQWAKKGGNGGTSPVATQVWGGLYGTCAELQMQMVAEKNGTVVPATMTKQTKRMDGKCRNDQTCIGLYRYRSFSLLLINQIGDQISCRKTQPHCKDYRQNLWELQSMYTPSRRFCKCLYGKYRIGFYGVPALTKDPVFVHFFWALNQKWISGTRE